MIALLVDKLFKLIWQVTLEIIALLVHIAMSPNGDVNFN